MVPALTAKPWLEVLHRIVMHSDNDHAVILAGMLWEIINESDDRTVARIVDHHASKLLEPAA